MGVLTKKHKSRSQLHWFHWELAEKYGLGEALMLKHLIYWIATNSMKGINRHDDRWWTYNSVKMFREYFTYWSEGQIRRILKSLVEQGLIIDGIYNKHGYDRTKWYALKDEKYWLENYNPVDKITEWKKEF